MPKVFIIIVNWNGYKDTIDCLKSLENIDYPNFEAVIVDNGSTDISVSEIKNQKSKIKNFELALIENGKNLGFAGGNNIGIKYALENGADFVLLLNNDTVVDPIFLSNLIEIGESNKNFGVLGPKIYYFSEPKRIWSAGGKMNWFCGNTQIDFNKINNSSEVELRKSYEGPRRAFIGLVEYISGCAMLIKKEVFEKIGLLYEPYFLYYEDVDFCLRARKAGYQRAVVPEAKIWHKVSQSTKSLGNPIFHYYNHRNILLLAKRNRPLFFYLAMMPWSVWKFCKQIPKLILMPSTQKISLSIMRGIIDFYPGKFGQKI